MIFLFIRAFFFRKRNGNITFHGRSDKFTGKIVQQRKEGDKEEKKNPTQTLSHYTPQLYCKIMMNRTYFLRIFLRS